MIRTRRARIVATLGPASRAPENVERLARLGVDVFRLNFSHGSHADHRAALDAVRAAELAIERPLAALADLQGPKLRLGTFASGKVELLKGQRFLLDLDSANPGSVERAPMPHPEIFAALSAGKDLLVDDGKVRLRVLEASPTHALTEVITPGFVSDRKGVNVPQAILPIDAMTPKDRTDLDFALDIGVDWVALSFVQRAADMAELKKIVAGRAACLAKIEKPAALERLDEILDYCDGVMVARGDLGVELYPEEVPIMQKRIVRAARSRGIPVIVATQMLESMITSPTPTRAEASDVANAVYEGADAVMLSAETASGQYPFESVEMMARIIQRVESDPNWPHLMDAEHPKADESEVDALSVAARQAADAIKPGCLVAWTSRGASARRLARERPLQPVLALTPHLNSARRLCLGWGLEPRVVTDPADLDDMTARACSLAVELGLAKKGQRLIIVAGVPFGTPGSTNLMRLAYA